MDSAELYMTLIRPSMVPILGEAWTFPFNLQIELATWGWKIANAEELRNAAKQQSKLDKRKADTKSAEDERNTRHLKRQLDAMQGGFDFEDMQRSFREARAEKDPKKREQKLNALGDEITSKEEFLRQRANKLKDTVTNKSEQEARTRQREAQTQDLNDQIADATKENFQFRFSKRVDFASTQMLNSMKQGDVFPTGIITVFQRAPNLNHAASLILTVQKLRLLDYKLRVEVTDTMTDMREDWTAEFYSLGYVYKSRGMIKEESGAQLVTAAITQGTPRVFAMSMKGTLPI